ncbi:gas vesicle protein GvpL [Natronobacterium gregoryi]|uniref:Gas vesicle protein GvpFL n=2 Tax=Natronobacterium gregoryi TaxID=44930 RepID=L0AK91_NATGS|nr:GvpL/GvpF family gas vesicle protein [Natronobacterium gregoryi]AFZ74206.1 Gas vesicle synthesis protein GvpL/GvpF [Natronobacterium gregoryi SP2]ELY63661.1 gas vesicle synthesis protein GvpLGvpF [Natronobacterium gregoryi SP2]PLK22004.1 gas vesicle protein GvpFL [Natronobacterium gregoryi SP2]SFI51469.1 Gas vesicle synthesis protein GvpL/GvpF [Natronobacterium gregoryi]
MSSDEPSDADPTADPGPDAPPEIDDGRYLYCIVQADEDVTLETTGVDGEPVSVVLADGIGAVVHTCDGIYDSADLAQVRRWLVRHQTVVDEAGEAFGTPVPFQFDTILRGDNEGVREWLREEADTLERALSELESHWEYRVEVVEIDPIDEAELIERDDRLRELEAKIDNSGEGAAFLLEKQFDQRLSELQAARRESLTADLKDRLGEETREVHALERSPAAALDDDVVDAGDDGETLCRFTLLAHEDDEEAVGSVLDDVATHDGLEVRFTGPWPPYTFAPELGGDGRENRPDDTAVDRR